MSSPHPRRPKRQSVAGEEEKAWIEFYKKSRDDPLLAAEVLAQLNNDSMMKRDRLALFLRCRESIRKDKARQARNQRMGCFIRKIIHWLIVLPWEALRRTGRASRDIVIEALPEVERPVRPALKPPAASSPGTPPAEANVPAVIRPRKRKPPRSLPEQAPPSADTEASSAS